MELSDKERVLLINQYKILEQVDEDNASYYKKMLTVLENGYELEYDELTYLAPPMSREDCKEVLSILGMFDVLQHSYEKLPDKSGIEEWKVKFGGFDGNNEGSQLGYTRYLTEQDNRYTHLVKGNKDLNSHCPVIDRYRTMLERFNGLNKPHKLTKEQILEIIQ